MAVAESRWNRDDATDGPSTRRPGLRPPRGTRYSRPRRPAPSPLTQQRLARRRWAGLIKQVWRVDPLVCPRCEASMKILSFIHPAQADVIEKILTHCGLWEQSSRAPPLDDRAAPPTPDPGELRYVSDLQSVDEPAPSEPLWIAD